MTTIITNKQKILQRAGRRGRGARWWRAAVGPARSWARPAAQAGAGAPPSLLWPGRDGAARGQEAAPPSLRWRKGWRRRACRGREGVGAGGRRRCAAPGGAEPRCAGGGTQRLAGEARGAGVWCSAGRRAWAASDGRRGGTQRTERKLALVGGRKGGEEEGKGGGRR